MRLSCIHIVPYGGGDTDAEPSNLSGRQPYMYTASPGFRREGRQRPGVRRISPSYYLSETDKDRRMESRRTFDREPYIHTARENSDGRKRNQIKKENARRFQPQKNNKRKRRGTQSAPPVPFSVSAVYQSLSASFMERFNLPFSSVPRNLTLTVSPTFTTSSTFSVRCC